MTNFKSIFSLDLKLNFLALYKDKKTALKRLGLLVLLLIAFAVPLAFVFIMLYYLAQAAVFGSYLDEILNLIFAGVQLMILVFFTPSYINSVWFSKDRQLLAAMPVSPSAVFLSRMLVMYLNTVMISFVVTIAGGAVIAAGSAAAVEDYAQAIAQGALELSPQAYVYGSADYYLMMFFTALTLPVIPLFVMAAVSFPIMKVISYLKQSSVLKTVIMIVVYGALFAALYVGMFYLQNSMGEMVFDGTEDAFAVLDKMLASLCGYTQHIYPSIWAARGMCGDWQSSLIYAAVILVLGAAALVGSRAFFSLADTRAVHASRRGGEKTVRLKTAGVRAALIKKDLVGIMREPQLAFQSFSSLILAPVMLLAFNLLLPMGAAEGTEGMYPSMLAGTSLCLMGAMSAANVLASVAVSREGKSFKIARFMPISSRDIVISKLLLADIFTFLSVVIDAVILIALGTFNVLDFFGSIICFTLLGLGLNSYGLLRDIKNPNFNYINYKELIKSSSKTLSSLLIAMIAAVAGMLLYMLLPSAGLTGYALSGVVWGVMAVICAAVCGVFGFRCIKRMSAALDAMD